ncbi:S41 family peptidase [Leptospira sp. 96542]|nr:S41 family peptidase [Leptospira sp. 96542]
MKQKERIFWILITTTLTIVSVFSFSERVSAISADGEKYLQILHEVISYVENDFVDPPDEKKIYVGAIQGALHSLGDPHTRFLDVDEFTELQNETKGSFGGIGVEVSFYENAFIIVAPIEGTPAWRAGLLPQDKIIEINGKSTKSVSLAESISMMRGEVGSSLSMKVERKGIKDPFVVNLVREQIKIKYVRSSYIEEEKTGYIKLVQFMGKENTAKEFSETVQSLVNSGAEKLVIDLRMNPGGLLDLAIDLAAMFLPTNSEIVSVKGRGGILVKSFKAENKSKKYLDIPIAILVNGGSASASEILAGALKDNNRAKIVGTQSFGKGSVQSILPLSAGTGVAITIQKYYTPSGISIHGKGITPDVVVNPVVASDDEKFGLEKLYKKNRIKPFLESHSEFNQTAINDFKVILEEEKIQISDTVVKLFLFNEMRVGAAYQKPNLDLDVQLTQAIRSLEK